MIIDTDGAVYMFEVWQDCEWCVGGESASLAEMEREATHYAMMYGQDGPVTVEKFVRYPIQSSASESSDTTTKV